MKRHMQALTEAARLLTETQARIMQVSQTDAADRQSE